MPNQPNIVLINCDDLGYGDLGCYGSTLNNTPAIDRLADSGVRFTDFYAPSPVCSPSRAAMLTGSYPLRVGFGPTRRGVLFPGEPFGLNPSEITIATLLQQAGWATALVGKWHCGDQQAFLPTRHGFDTYYGLPYSNDMGRQVPPPGMTHDELDDLMRQFDVPTERPPLPLLADDAVIEAQPDQASLTGRYLEQAVRFIRTSAADERPFFLYLAHMYVHLPIYVQQRFLDRSTNGAYGAAVECIDWTTDVLMRQLDTVGQRDNTIVIFTSDNGALSGGQGGSGSNGELRGAKGSTWEGGQRVPCIMSWPGTIAPGQVIATPTSGLDFYPTIAALCGVDVPTDRTIDGRDLTAMLFGTGDVDDAPFFYQSAGNIEAVRSGPWKLHVRKRNKPVIELYNLVDDAGETTDVADDQPEVVAELTALIEGARVEFGDSASGIEGRGVRPIGEVADPQPLTEYDPDHPYYMAEYDLGDRG